MPTYEYRCPNEHTFELFQRMSDLPPTSCEICGAAPVERVLSQVAIHFKGSGFYSTDYGRGKKDGAKEGEAPSKTAEKPKESDKKAAPAASSDSGS
jgi:putative FmdB family regulatory protein